VHCKNNWLSYGKKEIFNKSKLGYGSPIYTSRINGRPFIFEDIENQLTLPGSGFGVWYLNLIAERNWKDIDVE